MPIVKKNAEGRVPSKYPEKFNARENRLKTHNNCLVEVVDAEYEVTVDEAVTHVAMVASTATPKVVLPDPKLCEGRSLKVSVNIIAGSATLSFNDVDHTISASCTVEMVCFDASWKVFSQVAEPSVLVVPPAP